MPRTTEDLWRGFEQELRASLSRRVGDPHVVDDLMQETFLRLHDHRQGLRDEESVGGWLHRVAHNLWRDRLRRARVENSAAWRDVGAAPHPGPLPLATPNDAADLNRIVAAWLPDLIEQLPETDREALRLAELEGRPAREVAAILNLSLTAAKSRIQRARHRLRDVVLSCCHVDLDRRGNVVEYRRRGDCRGCRDD